MIACILKQLPLKYRIIHFYDRLEIFDNENCYELLKQSIKYNKHALVDYAIERGAGDLNVGLIYAVRFDNLIDFFVLKGATDFYRGLIEAAIVGNIRLVKYFESQGGRDYNTGLMCAAIGGHFPLIRYFIKQGAASWNLGYIGARHSNNEELMKFFIEQGADREFECPICLKFIDEKDMSFIFCSHFFHTKCIDEWKEINSTCPNCRRYFYKASELIT